MSLSLSLSVSVPFCWEDMGMGQVMGAGRWWWVPEWLGAAGRFAIVRSSSCFVFFPPQTQSSLSLSVSVYLLLPLAFSRGVCARFCFLPPAPPPADGRKGEKQKSGRLMGQKCGWALLTWEPVPLYGGGGVVLIAVVLCITPGGSLLRMSVSLLQGQ